MNEHIVYLSTSILVLLMSSIDLVDCVWQIDN